MFGLVDYASDQEEDKDDDKPEKYQSFRFSLSLDQSVHNVLACTGPKIPMVAGKIETTKIPNQQTIDRIKHYLQLKNQGFNLTDSIRTKKDFGNPYILQKVIDYYHIDEVDGLSLSLSVSLCLTFTCPDGFKLSSPSLESFRI
jgi:hypothetical protein